MKYAKVSGSLRWSGGTTILSAGITTADDDHPLVLERPDLWTDQAPTASLAGPSGGKTVGPDPRDARITELETELAERDAEVARLTEGQAATIEDRTEAPIERATRAPGERRPVRPRGEQK